jgi:hypothetical protein
MSLAIQKADFFKQDYAIRFAWYVDEGLPKLNGRLSGDDCDAC